jgi:hypothetical protein
MHRSASRHRVPVSPPPTALIGQVRRFGVHGVLYEVLGIISPDKARIRVIETGEETFYPISKLREDPES